MRNDNTPYHRRVAKRLQKAKEQQIRRMNNKYSEVDKFMVVFERAWQEYYQIPCDLRYAHGWYYVNGRKYNHRQLEKLMGLLLARLQELESPNPDEETSDGQEAA